MVKKKVINFNEMLSSKKNWKLIFFYYNKLDPRILVPQRFSKIGWMPNFAYPSAISLLLFSILIIIIPLLIIFSTNPDNISQIIYSLIFSLIIITLIGTFMQIQSNKFIKIVNSK